MSPAELAPGRRVQTHPATDRWAMGDRYGVVVAVGRRYVRVLLDRSGQTVRFPLELLELVD